MFERFTSEARRVVAMAQEAATTRNGGHIGTEHILLGILRCRGSQAVEALNSMGVTHEAARLCVQPTMPGLAPEPAGINGEGDQRQGITAQARRILEGSLREAAKRHEGYIGVEHLLLALLADSRNGAVQTLEALKTTPKAIRRRLELDWEAISAASQAAGVQTHAIG